MSEMESSSNVSPRKEIFPQMESVLQEHSTGIKVFGSEEDDVLCLYHYQPESHRNEDKLSTSSLNIIQKLKKRTSTNDIPIDIINVMDKARVINESRQNKKKEKGERFKLFRSTSSLDAKRCSLCFEERNKLYSESYCFTDKTYSNTNLRHPVYVPKNVPLLVSKQDNYVAQVKLVTKPQPFRESQSIPSSDYNQNQQNLIQTPQNNSEQNGGISLRDEVMNHQPSRQPKQPLMEFLSYHPNEYYENLIKHNKDKNPSQQSTPSMSANGSCQNNVQGCHQPSGMNMNYGYANNIPQESVPMMVPNYESVPNYGQPQSMMGNGYQVYQQPPPINYEYQKNVYQESVQPATMKVNYGQPQPMGSNIGYQNVYQEPQSMTTNVPYQNNIPQKSAQVPLLKMSYALPPPTTNQPQVSYQNPPKYIVPPLALNQPNEEVDESPSPESPNYDSGRYHQARNNKSAYRLVTKSVKETFPKEKKRHYSSHRYDKRRVYRCDEVHEELRPSSHQEIHKHQRKPRIIESGEDSSPHLEAQRSRQAQRSHEYQKSYGYQRSRQQQKSHEHQRRQKTVEKEEDSSPHREMQKTIGSHHRKQKKIENEEGSPPRQQIRRTREHQRRQKKVENEEDFSPHEEKSRTYEHHRKENKIETEEDSSPDQAMHHHGRQEEDVNHNDMHRNSHHRRYDRRVENQSSDDNRKEELQKKRYYHERRKEEIYYESKRERNHRHHQHARKSNPEIQTHHAHDVRKAVQHHRHQEARETIPVIQHDVRETVQKNPEGQRHHHHHERRPKPIKTQELRHHNNTRRPDAQKHHSDGRRRPSKPLNDQISSTDPVDIKLVIDPKWLRPIKSIKQLCKRNIYTKASMNIHKDLLATRPLTDDDSYLRKYVPKIIRIERDKNYYKRIDEERYKNKIFPLNALWYNNKLYERIPSPRCRRASRYPLYYKSSRPRREFVRKRALKWRRNHLTHIIEFKTPSSEVYTDFTCSSLSSLTSIDDSIGDHQEPQLSIGESSSTDENIKRPKSDYSSDIEKSTSEIDDVSHRAVIGRHSRIPTRKLSKPEPDPRICQESVAKEEIEDENEDDEEVRDDDSHRAVNDTRSIPEEVNDEEIADEEVDDEDDDDEDDDNEDVDDEDDDDEDDDNEGVDDEDVDDEEIDDEEVPQVEEVEIQKATRVLKRSPTKLDVRDQSFSKRKHEEELNVSKVEEVKKSQRSVPEMIQKFESYPNDPKVFQNNVEVHQQSGVKLTKKIRKKPKSPNDELKPIKTPENNVCDVTQSNGSMFGVESLPTDVAEPENDVTPRRFEREMRAYMIHVFNMYDAPKEEVDAKFEEFRIGCIKLGYGHYFESTQLPDAVSEPQENVKPEENVVQEKNLNPEEMSKPAPEPPKPVKVIKIKQSRKSSKPVQQHSGVQERTRICKQSTN